MADVDKSDLIGRTITGVEGGDALPFILIFDDGSRVMFDVDMGWDQVEEFYLDDDDRKPYKSTAEIRREQINERNLRYLNEFKDVT